MKGKIIWMPHAGHFIRGERCQFRLNTYVNGYIVSTVGEFVSSIKPTDAPFQNIGSNRLYETMVFHAKRSEHKCCPYRAMTGTDLDSAGYNEADAACKGHLEMVKKWSRKRVRP